MSRLSLTNRQKLAAIIVLLMGSLIAIAVESYIAAGAMDRAVDDRNFATVPHVAHALRLLIVALVPAVCVVAIILAIHLKSCIVVPLTKAAATLRKVAEGDLTQRMIVTDARDELGQMGVALNETLDRIGAVIRDLRQQAELLAGASTELAAVSDTMTTTVEGAAEQAGSVASAAEEVSNTTGSVSTGAAQMTASIAEIARNAQEAAQAARAAVGAATSANKTVTKLDESSSQIAEIVALITTIAEQTHLLALNATIEAARAGAAGRGFAVVASEVKELAQETARASEEIAHRIEAIRLDSAEAVAAIGGFTEVIARIDDYQATIASAVEEQTATTREIGRGVEEVAGGSHEIAASISTVADALTATRSGASDTRKAAAELARLAESLNESVAGFIV